MEDKRNRLVVPRNVVNVKMLYTLYILKELSKGEVIFGNKILSIFRESFTNSNAPFPISSSTVYETLYSLEENGYVVSKWSGDEFLNKRSKKIYSITDEGLKYYKLNIANYVDGIEKTKSSLDIIIKLLK